MPIDMHPFLPLSQGAKEEPLVHIQIENPNDESAEKIERELGLIDTGADWCYFPRSYAKKLNINLSRRNKMKRGVIAAGKKRKGWRHSVKLRVFVTQQTTPKPVFVVDTPVIDVEITVVFVHNLKRAILGVRHFLGKYVFTINYNKRRFSMRIADKNRACEICQPL